MTARPRPPALPIDRPTTPLRLVRVVALGVVHRGAWEGRWS